MTVQCDQDDESFHTVNVGGTLRERGSGRHPEGGKVAGGAGGDQPSQKGGKDGEKGSGVGKWPLPKDVHVLVSGTCEYILLHNKEKLRLKMELQLLIN